MEQNVPPIDLQTRIFTLFAKKSKFVINLFHFLYFAGLVILLVLTYLGINNQRSSLVYEIGRHCGQAALTLLGVVVLPGILGRLKIEIKITRTITLFRRQLGITVFLLALAHYTLVRLVPILSGYMSLQIPYPNLFENFGAIALFLLFLLFLTSNDIGKKKLGIWWTILHRFVYLIIWVLVLHTGLQKISVWTIGIFIVGVLEIVSWVIYFLRKKPSVPTASPSVIKTTSTQ